MLVAGGALLSLAGCVLDRSAAERALAFKPSLCEAAAQGPLLQTVLLEVPVGEAFLQRELWQTHPSAADGETRALLAENGLRACVVRGHLPDRLRDLLTSELHTVNPQVATFASRKREVLATNGPLTSVQFEAARRLGAPRTTYALQQASLGWEVTPEALEEGDTRLCCLPILQYGERQEWLRPSEDGTQFVLHGEPATLRFPDMTLRVVLGPKDYLLIGGDAEAVGTLGYSAFVLAAGGGVKQRVLVIRATSPSRSPGVGPAPSRLAGQCPSFARCGGELSALGR